MNLGGLKKTTLTDYPGKLACFVFTMGCNYRCPFCYNAELVLPEAINKQMLLPEKDFFNFLKKEKGRLEAVCLTGGEPTINSDIIQFSRKVKKLGYLLKIDTNGSNPEALKELLEKGLVDYLAMDIKAPREKYGMAIGFGKASLTYFLEKIQESINIIKKSRVDYEFRTTIVPGLLSRKDILKIVHWIRPARKYVLQKFQPGKTLEPKMSEAKPYPEEFFLSLKADVSPFFGQVELR